MHDPPHHGHVIQTLGFAEDTQPAEMAERLGLVERQPSLDPEVPLTPSVALALEAVGVSIAPYWMRMREFYDPAQ